MRTCTFSSRLKNSIIHISAKNKPKYSVFQLCNLSSLQCGSFRLHRQLDGSTASCGVHPSKLSWFRKFSDWTIEKLSHQIALSLVMKYRHRLISLEFTSWSVYSSCAHGMDGRTRRNDVMMPSKTPRHASYQINTKIKRDVNVCVWYAPNPTSICYNLL